MADPRFTVWSDKDGITVHIGDGVHRSTATVSVACAERLIADLRRHIDRMPRVACASDLGLEAA